MGSRGDFVHIPAIQGAGSVRIPICFVVSVSLRLWNFRLTLEHSTRRKVYHVSEPPLRWVPEVCVLPRCCVERHLCETVDLKDCIVRSTTTEQIYFSVTRFQPAFPFPFHRLPRSARMRATTYRQATTHGPGTAICPRVVTLPSPRPVLYPPQQAS